MTASKVSKPASDKTSKGTVQVITSHDRLQLRFRFGGERYYPSIGLPALVPHHRSGDRGLHRQKKQPISSARRSLFRWGDGHCDHQQHSLAGMSGGSGHG